MIANICTPIFLPSSPPLFLPFTHVFSPLPSSRSSLPLFPSPLPFPFTPSSSLSFYPPDLPSLLPSPSSLPPLPSPSSLPTVECDITHSTLKVQGDLESNFLKKFVIERKISVIFYFTELFGVVSCNKLIMYFGYGKYIFIK